MFYNKSEYVTSHEAEYFILLNYEFKPVYSDFLTRINVINNSDFKINKLCCESNNKRYFYAINVNKWYWERGMKEDWMDFKLPHTPCEFYRIWSNNALCMDCGGQEDCASYNQ